MTSKNLILLTDSLELPCIEQIEKLLQKKIKAQFSFVPATQKHSADKWEESKMKYEPPMYFEGVSESEYQTCQSILKTAGIDHAYLPALRARDFGLLVMDMDSTLITIECIDEIADMCGLKPQVAAITEAAMRGDIDYPQSLQQRVALLKGLSVNALQQVYDARLRFSPGAHALLAFAKQAGWKTLLVSGGFTFFTERVKAQLGLDFAYSNTLEIENGKLTGRVQGTVVDAAEKARLLNETCAQLGFLPSQAIAVGDGANDLLMMQAAGLSVAYHAKPRVQQEAKVALNHVGLDGIIKLFAAQ